MDGKYTYAEHTYIVATLQNIASPTIKERYSLPSSTKEEILSLPSPFQTAYAECVFLRTYSRRKEVGSLLTEDKETWGEVVIRVIEGTIEAYLTHYRKNGLDVNMEELNEFASKMALSFFHRHWSPPGRGLFAMGTDHTRQNGNATLNNCYACETHNLVLAGSWAMDQLMCGGGIGFDCSWDGNILRPNKEDNFLFVVPDTRQGWVAATELLLRAYLPIEGEITNKFPTYDYSLIRPYGAPIRGFGGTASGPEPLIKLIKSLEIFLDTYLDFQEAPSNDVFRRMAERLNDIGAYYYNDEEKAKLEKALQEHKKVYDKTRLVVDVINSIGACVVAGNVRRCLPGEAMVQTREGLKPITEVKVGDYVKTMREDCRVTEKLKQGHQKLIKIITNDGEFRCTPNHRMAVTKGRNSYEWKEAQNLTHQDSLISIRQDNRFDVFSSPHPSKVISLQEDIIEETYDISVLGRNEFFCQGYLTHNSAQIALSNAGDMTFIDLKNTDVNPERAGISWMSNNTVRFVKTEDFQDFIPDIAQRIVKNGEPGFLNILNFHKYARFTDKSYGKDAATLVNPCGEVCLNSFEPCTLSTICPSRCLDNDKISLSKCIKAAEYATFYASTVTLVKHHWGVSNEIIAKNRRIGVSLTGITNIYEEYGATYLTTLSRKLYKEIRRVNTRLAERAGVPRSIRVSTVKPEGTLSIVMEVNAGVHFPICRFAKRRVGFAIDDPLLKPLQEAGYEIEPSTYNSTMVYVIFPIKSQGRSEREVGIYEQFALVASLQRCYSDNSVSFTGHFSIERESHLIENVIAQHAPIIKACSLLPYSDNVNAKPIYKHMPFEEILEETYHEIIAKIKPVVWNFQSKEDGVLERGCNGDVCLRQSITE